MRPQRVIRAAALAVGACLLCGSPSTATAAERSHGFGADLALARRIVDAWFAHDTPETRAALQRANVVLSTATMKRPARGLFAARTRERYENNESPGMCGLPDLYWTTFSGPRDLALTAQGPAVLEHCGRSARTTHGGLVHERATADIQSPARLIPNKLAATWAVWHALRRTRGQPFDVEAIGAHFAGGAAKFGGK